VYHLSIIIPLYNEEKRLQKSLKCLKKFLLKKKKNKVETIFVSDGSTDNTNKLINLFISKNKKFYKFKFIFYQKNVGKGYAIKQGIMKASYDWQLICDADMSVEVGQFDDWYKKKMINNKNVAYFGSRKHKYSKVKAIKKRRYLGSIFIWILKILFQIKIKDTQCGFKVFHKNYASRVFKKLLSYRFVFDVELILILKKKNISIKELPLKWTHKEDGKLNLMKDIPIMFFDILMIKLREIIK
jgi:dolichyl-phosphate beta-glucosyltransferase